jgi:predicted permease
MYFQFFDNTVVASIFPVYYVFFLIYPGHVDAIFIEISNSHLFDPLRILKFSTCFIPVEWIYRIAGTRSMF